MVEKWKKQLIKLDKNGEIKKIVKDIIENNLKNYEIKKLTGYKNIFRIRKGKIRIVFKKDKGENILIKIESRGDVYKSI